MLHVENNVVDVVRIMILLSVCNLLPACKAIRAGTCIAQSTINAIHDAGSNLAIGLPGSKFFLDPI